MDAVMEEVLDNTVQMLIDVHHKHIGRNHDPRYRLYINDELFSERCYRFESDMYLTEQLFVTKKEGTYKIKIESISGFSFKLRNLRCKYGTAQIINDEVFKL